MLQSMHIFQSCCPIAELIAPCNRDPIKVSELMFIEMVVVNRLVCGATEALAFTLFTFTSAAASATIPKAATHPR